MTKENDAKRTLSVEETAVFLGIGRDSCYRAVRSGEIPSLRIGRRFRVPRAALEAMLADVSYRQRDAA